MERYLRDWREEAARKNQYDTAIFVGDKVVAYTDNKDDIKRLAQLYYLSGNHARAQSLLLKHDLLQSSPQCKYLAADCHVKQGLYEQALKLLGERTPAHLREPKSNSRRKLAPGDIHGHGSASKDAVRRSKQDHHPTAAGYVEQTKDSSTTDMRFEAGMCYLRGVCHAKLNAFDIARTCYMDAVRIDVQCFEAFDQLMKNALLSPDEEWDFLNSLDFDSVSTPATTNGASTSSFSSTQGGDGSGGEAADLTKMLYTTRLSKYKNHALLSTATETLSTHYHLSTNPDLLLSRAELLFTQCRFRPALSLTTQILTQDPHATAPLPVHLACLHETSSTNALFLLAHQLADSRPDEPTTWLAVGVYYLSTNKIPEARRFFSKSSTMDPHLGAAWIGFAHTFAAEGEHDQAIAAYSTAARLFQGTHLPQLFLGMQSLQNANWSLAREFLGVAHGMCGDADPLLLNEMGVVAFHEGQMERAIALFSDALELADETDADAEAYNATRVNLGHALRRVEKFEEAVEMFESVLRGGGREAGVFSAKGLCLLEMGGRVGEAVACAHEALGMRGGDGVAGELLARALEDAGAAGGGGGDVLGFGIGGLDLGATSSFGGGRDYDDGMDVEKWHGNGHDADINSDDDIDDGGGGGGGGGGPGMRGEDFEKMLQRRKLDAVRGRAERSRNGNGKGEGRRRRRRDLDPDGTRRAVGAAAGGEKGEGRGGGGGGGGEEEEEAS